ncbi:MAG: gamma-glutamyltransferase [Chloroflexota bacterium]
MATSSPIPPSSPRARGGRRARGAVVAPHHLATRAGLSVLAAGGHAVDAAIATNAVLGVVMPSGCGIGGDAFWLVWDEAAGEQVALNGSRRPPGSPPGAAARARAGSRAAARSITVPGTVRSWAVRIGGEGGCPAMRPRARHRAGVGRVPALGRTDPGGRGAVAEIAAEPWARGVRPGLAA